MKDKDKEKRINFGGKFITAHILKFLPNVLSLH